MWNVVTRSLPRGRRASPCRPSGPRGPRRGSPPRARRSSRRAWHRCGAATVTLSWMGVIYISVRVASVLDRDWGRTLATVPSYVALVLDTSAAVASYVASVLDRYLGEGSNLAVRMGYPRIIIHAVSRSARLGIRLLDELHPRLVARVRVRERERVAAAARDRQVVVDRDRAPRAVLVYKATTVCRAAVTRRCEGDRTVCDTSTLCAPRSLRPWRVLCLQPRSFPLTSVGAFRVGGVTLSSSSLPCRSGRGARRARRPSGPSRAPTAALARRATRAPTGTYR